MNNEQPINSLLTNRDEKDNKKYMKEFRFKQKFFSCLFFDFQKYNYKNQVNEYFKYEIVELKGYSICCNENSSE